MSSMKPAFLYKDILHVRISDETYCSVEAGPGVCDLTVSHGAFRRDSASGYHSPALAAIEGSDEEWIFFDWWTGSWAESTFRFQLREIIRGQNIAEGAFFDEALGENGSLAFASDDAGFVFDNYGNIPSCMLLRRAVLHKLLKNVESLYPYPIQKLWNAARREGMQLDKIHQVIRKEMFVQDHLIIPADRQKLLRGKNQSKKKLLVITHELSWTGAPLVLAEACISVLKSAGYEIMILSQKEGPAVKKYLENGISVMTLPEIAQPESKLLFSLVQPYDAIIVNTIVPYASLKILNALDKPVLWWIHECEMIYHGLEQHLPRELSPNVHAYCVSQYALDILKKFRPNYDARILVYGLQDPHPVQETSCVGENRRLRFATVGSVVNIKGQDILAEAIALLTEEVREKCEFLFVGKTEDADILAELRRLEQRYPQNVRYIGPVPREDLDGIYPEVNCIICPSRYDCMPTFVAEGMSYGKPAICSENTGTAPILRFEEAGYVYPDNDPVKLAAAITEYVSLSEDVRHGYSVRARACFDKYYNVNVFRKNFLQAMDALMLPNAEME